MRILSVATMLLILPAASVGALTAEDCPTHKYADHFGPQRDQDSRPDCFAYQGAALFEEQACLEDSKYCGNSFSPLDIARCGWSKSNSWDLPSGGSPKRTLSCAAESGICLESDAPSFRIQNYSCSPSLFSSTTDVGCLVEELTRIFNRKAELDPSKCRQGGSRFAALKALEAHLKTVASPAAKLGVDLEKALESSISPKDFIYKVLIPPSCEKNRWSSKNLSAQDVHTFPLIPPQLMIAFGLLDQAITPDINRPSEEKLKAVMKVLNSGRSVGISMCAEAFRDFHLSEHLDPIEWIFGKEKKCGLHAVVITGSQLAKDKRTCQIQVKNSWGEGSSLEGWMDADAVLSKAFLMEYLGPEIVK